MLSTALLLAASMVVGQAEAAPPLPPEVAEELQKLEGTWSAEGDVTGMALRGKWSGKLAADGRCVSFTYKVTLDGMRIQGVGVVGYDAANDELVTAAFFSDGTMEMIREKRVEQGLSKGTYTGCTQGKSFKAACTTRWQGKDSWSFTTEELGDRGEKKGTLTVTFTRIAKKSKKHD